jgi:hypothetical protein
MCLLILQDAQVGELQFQSPGDSPLLNTNKNLKRLPIHVVQIRIPACQHAIHESRHARLVSLSLTRTPGLLTWAPRALAGTSVPWALAWQNLRKWASRIKIITLRVMWGLRLCSPMKSLRRRRREVLRCHRNVMALCSERAEREIVDKEADSNNQSEEDLRRFVSIFLLNYERRTVPSLYN